MTPATLKATIQDRHISNVGTPTFAKGIPVSTPSRSTEALLLDIHQITWTFPPPPTTWTGILKGALLGGKCRLQFPVSYEVTEDSGNFYGFIEILNLPAYGTTMEEVMYDLELAVFEYYEVLVSEKDSRLGGRLLAHKAILEKLIVM